MSETFQLTRPAHQFKLKLADPGKPPVALTEKHRPRDLAGIVGQPAVVARLGAFLEGPYSGAFLFVGSTGVGKTTAALALAAELGSCEYGGLHVIKSGMQDAEAVEKVLRDLRYTPMMGSGWKVVIVDEADYMSVKAAQLWLSSLEELPPRSVVVFTTNNPDKFKDRFVDRCERLDFESEAAKHMGDAQTVVDTVWLEETGGWDLGGPPDVKDLTGIVDANGSISYRRVVQRLAPLIAARRTSPPPPTTEEVTATTLVELARRGATTDDLIAFNAERRATEEAPAVEPAKPKRNRTPAPVSEEVAAKRRAAAAKGVETWRRNQAAIAAAAEAGVSS